jgi:uncharacterized membrane protein
MFCSCPEVSPVADGLVVVGVELAVELPPRRLLMTPPTPLVTPLTTEPTPLSGLVVVGVAAAGVAAGFAEAAETGAALAVPVSPPVTVLSWLTLSPTSPKKLK